MAVTSLRPARWNLSFEGERMAPIPQRGNPGEAHENSWRWARHFDYWDAAHRVRGMPYTFLVVADENRQRAATLATGCNLPHCACPLLAQSGHTEVPATLFAFGAKRTCMVWLRPSLWRLTQSAHRPDRKAAAQQVCQATGPGHLSFTRIIT